MKSFFPTEWKRYHAHEMYPRDLPYKVNTVNTFLLTQSKQHPLQTVGSWSKAKSHSVEKKSISSYIHNLFIVRNEIYVCIFFFHWYMIFRSSMTYFAELSKWQTICFCLKVIWVEMYRVVFWSVKLKRWPGKSKFLDFK